MPQFRICAGPSRSGWSHTELASFSSLADQLLSVWFGWWIVCLVACNCRSDALLGQEPSPVPSAERITTAAGLETSLVVSEPLLRQPVAIDFDDRGRLWAIQYLQYPNPAGLQRVAVDRYSRTVYDRVPEPPPHGPQGADRITIFKDQDGDGVMDASHDFVSGLNLASGFAFGHGGVFVLNVPYLLFYPDRNRDDVPDAEPTVLLSGFGMQDAHSVANSLTFGPDGWLYGCQGSTVTANVRGIEFQQGVWRYHFPSDRFELFCEGGGNSWGLDFDASGELFYSTNYGGYVLLHAVQGGYFVKSFAKHGELHNRFTYGYFEHAAHKNFRGGHVTVGGIVYQADALSAAFRGTYVAGDLLGHTVQWHTIEPDASSVRTRHGGVLIDSHDPWFAPTDVVQGPDGAIYVSDWCDARTAHPDPDAQWDRSNGRIYRIAPPQLPMAKVDLTDRTSQELLDLHSHANQWFVRRARQELVRRNDLSVIEPLTARALRSPDGLEALEALWSLASLQSIPRDILSELLTSPHAPVRKWAVRLIGDQAAYQPVWLSEHLAAELDALAETEPDLSVRVQLACTAARLPAAQALPIINANINRDIDLDDSRLPWLWWWAIERHCLSGRDEVLRRFVRPSLWKSQLGSSFLLPRLVRRYAAEASPVALDAIFSLWQAAPDQNSQAVFWEPLWQGLWEVEPNQSAVSTSRLGQLSQQVAQHALGAAIREAWETQRESLPLTRLAVFIHYAPAVEHARHTAFDPSADQRQRLELLALLNQVHDAESIPRAVELLRTEQAAGVQLLAVSMLAKSTEPQPAATLLETYRTSSDSAVQARIREVMFAQPELAKQFMAAVTAGQIDRGAVPVEQVRQILRLEDADLVQQVTQLWGKLAADSRGEILAEIRRLNNDLRAATGDPLSGQALFTKHCASCHRLFNQGAAIGPDLTTANRQDREFLLSSLVDPSHTIRPEYVSLVLQTIDGRVLNGLPTRRSESSIELAVLVNQQLQQVTIPSSEIDELRVADKSLMPDELYKLFSPQELRDLFAYVQLQHPLEN